MNDLIEDMTKIEFYPGKDKKYTAKIPSEIYNKYRKTNHKSDVYISFGAKGYQQYKDLIGDYSEYDHGDKKRREAYRARHSKIKNKSGDYVYKIPFTPAFFSYYLLW